MRDFKVFVSLADLHFGVKHVSAASMRDQLKEHFFKTVDRMPYLDGIFILGDTLHTTTTSLNSDYSELFMWFASKIYKLARKRNATVIWIAGTLSHDGQQLSTIKHYVNNDDGIDFRVYDTVEETEIWDTYKLLILPDVKVKKLSDIGDKLVPGRYDMILGHGTIDTMQYFVQESENMPTKTYVYDVEKLMAASKGPVMFGHIHQYQTIANKFCYVGPFTMLERGWQDAGFVIGAIYNKDTTKFKFEHYLNPDSASYTEINVTRHILNTIPIDEIIESIDEIISETKENDLITLRITRGDEISSAEKVMMLENRYRSDRRISIVKKIKNKQDRDREQVQKDRKDHFAYLMDETEDLPVILYRYYEEEIKPTIPANSGADNLVLEDFIRALSTPTN